MNTRAILIAGTAALAAITSATSEGVSQPGESRAYRAYITSAARDGLPSPPATTPTPSPGELPSLPAGWPSTFELGHSDAPGGAASTASAGLRFRYQYLAGGANTGSGWRTWSPGDSFVSNYISESAAVDVTPVFTYYMLRQSAPGANANEPDGIAANITNAATMRALFDDLQAFFVSASKDPEQLVVFHFEPDFWGYIQQASQADDASTVQVKVAASGHPEVAGLPDNASGLARAVVQLRDRFAPNVVLAYHLSYWGTGVDPLYADPSPDALAELSARSAAFYQSLQAPFDITFAELSDRDAGFKQVIYGDGGASWFDSGDFERNADYLRHFSRAAHLRVVLWQIPQGNTLMRAMNDTWNHFQDNKVEWLIGEGSADRLKPYLAAGVVALLFGRGADGATCACDASGDGATNPTPINGNNRPSLSPDDDGGYFRERLAAFRAQPPTPLP